MRKIRIDDLKQLNNDALYHVYFVGGKIWSKITPLQDLYMFARLRHFGIKA